MVQSRHPCIALCTCEEDDALALVRESAIEMQRPMWLWSATRGVRDGILADSAMIADSEHPAAALTYLLQSSPAALTALLDLNTHLKDAKTLRLLRDLIARYDRGGGTLVLIDHDQELPEPVRAIATPFELSLPDEKELEEIFRATIRAERDVNPIEIAINPRELSMIIRNLSGLSARQARRVILDTISADSRLDAQDVNRVLAEKRRYFQRDGLLEYIEAPVDLSEIGGLNHLKRWLAQRQCAMSGEAMAFGIPAPRGILMLGVQGAGKSLSAKAVATAWGRPLLRLDPSILYDRYVGESERHLREALQQAEAMSPIILWIDEIEKGFASAASQSTDGGLSQRMFGTFLTWLQEHHSPVFTIATANDIGALPPELLRKGRFDEIFFVDLPKLEARAAIFSIQIRKRKRDPMHFDIAALAAASDGFSGAEIEQAVISALHEAFTAREELSTKGILHVLEESPPLSVTMAERVQVLREWAKGRCVPAD